MLYSIPQLINPINFQIAILPSKLEYIKKYKYPGTNIYNIKELLFDENLKTIQIERMWTGISEIFNKNKSRFKKNVYEFVASNSEQMILMLQGKRMDWVDISSIGDYHIKKFNISDDKISLINFSQMDPSLMTLKDVDVAFYKCVGTNLSKLKKVMVHINRNIKKIRTNQDIWNKNLKMYFKAINMPYIPPKDFG